MSVLAPPYIFHQGAHDFFVSTVNRAAAGLDVELTSYWRSVEQNRLVGGSGWSQHLVGWAVDVVGPDENLFAERVRSAGLIPVLEIDHTHVQLAPAGFLEALFNRFF